jgi:hypothetical protein
MLTVILGISPRRRCFDYGQEGVLSASTGRPGPADDPEAESVNMDPLGARDGERFEFGVKDRAVGILEKVLLSLE